MSEYVPVDLGLEYAAEGAPFAIPSKERLTEWLNHKAAEGWRLIAVDQCFYYFERKATRLRLTPDYSHLPARNPETRQ